MIVITSYTGDDDQKDWVSLVDNNFPNEVVWMRPSEFLQRWKGNGQGWTVILTAAPPPPVPRN
jgi:hypothetical protein